MNQNLSDMPKISEVEECICALTEVIDALHCNFDKLSERLSPVLGPLSPPDPSGTSVQSHVTPLACSLKSKTEALEHLDWKIGRVTRALGI